MKFLTLIILLSFGLLINAQTIEGHLYDEDQNPIEWANIINYSKGEHTHSDPNGYFKLNHVDLGDSIIVSFIGYQSFSLIVANFENSLSVTMKVKSVAIDEVVIAPTIDALSLFTDINIKINPVSSSQQILTQVPGLFIGQHAGGGKAEQIFLRGFDIDHGTDIGITIDNMPVNMVSHAHGQGYADLHFIIPETIDNIDFGKGSYNSQKGNFTTAGYVDFKTQKKLKSNLIKLEADKFNMQRLLGMFSIFDSKKRNAYIASEHILNEGYFESPQNFSRTNVFIKYNESLNQNHSFTATASHFKSQWLASGQIPQRAVDNGTISRFGAIDDTEGGKTSRTNLMFSSTSSLSKNTFLKNNIFYSKYQFELFSNFTFFLNDPVNGDQIVQREARNMWGLNSELSSNTNIGDFNFQWKYGLSLRMDDSQNNELSHTLNRNILLNRSRYGNIIEQNLASYIMGEVEIGHFLFNIGGRFDYFNFNYHDLILENKNSANHQVFSPKLNLIYNLNNNTQFYFKIGRGFHSNDTRVSVDPNTNNVLPSSLSSDLGVILKPNKHMLINLAFWNLSLEQEFVYVGDEGIVEINGQSIRKGLDFSLQYQPINALFWNIDFNYAFARFSDAKENENYIPLAPDFTLSSGIKYLSTVGIYGGLNFRYMDNRPANEDNSIIAKGYAITDINLGYEFKHLNFSLHLQNLFNTDWNESQFATSSRLDNEYQPVEEIHFTPGTPFNIRATLAYSF